MLATRTFRLDDALGLLVEQGSSRIVQGIYSGLRDQATQLPAVPATERVPELVAVVAVAVAVPKTVPTAITHTEASTVPATESIPIPVVVSTVATPESTVVPTVETVVVPTMVVSALIVSPVPTSLSIRSRTSHEESTSHHRDHQ